MSGMQINFSIGDAEITAELSFVKFPDGQSTSHFHIYNEIHFVIDGNCTLTTQDEVYSVKKDDVVVIPLNTVHDIKKCDDMFTRFVIGFSIAKLNNKANECVHKEFFAQFESVKKIVVCNSDFGFIIPEIMKCWKNDGFFNHLILKEYLKILILKVADMLRKSKNEEKKKLYIANSPTIIIEQYLSENSSNSSANLTELAKLLNLSRKQAERTVLNLTGKNFKKLLQMRRMSEAKELLERTDMKISEIATRVGYNSYETFYRAFVKFYNFNPKDLRK